MAGQFGTACGFLSFRAVRGLIYGNQTVQNRATFNVNCSNPVVGKLPSELLCPQAFYAADTGTISLE